MPGINPNKQTESIETATSTSTAAAKSNNNPSTAEIELTPEQFWQTLATRGIPKLNKEFKDLLRNNIDINNFQAGTYELGAGYCEDIYNDNFRRAIIENHKIPGEFYLVDIESKNKETKKLFVAIDNQQNIKTFPLVVLANGFVRVNQKDLPAVQEISTKPAQVMLEPALNKTPNVTRKIIEKPTFLSQSHVNTQIKKALESKLIDRILIEGKSYTIFRGKDKKGVDHFYLTLMQQSGKVIIDIDTKSVKHIHNSATSAEKNALQSCVLKEQQRIENKTFLTKNKSSVEYANFLNLLQHRLMNPAGKITQDEILDYYHQIEGFRNLTTNVVTAYRDNAGSSSVIKDIRKGAQDAIDNLLQETNPAEKIKSQSAEIEPHSIAPFMPVI